MIPIITAFRSSPDRGRGLARDMRIRWALEEVRQPYSVRLVSFEEMKETAHIELQPFSQIPTYEEGQLVLFETGAIVLHIANTYDGLMPSEISARARAMSWMFASVNTIEPTIMELENASFLSPHITWKRELQSIVEKRVKLRLAQLSLRLGDSEWLESTFSAADLMMASVLLRLKSTELLSEFSNLQAYVARAEARPAYVAAFKAQHKVFIDSTKI